MARDDVDRFTELVPSFSRFSKSNHARFGWLHLPRLTTAGVWANPISGRQCLATRLRRRVGVTSRQPKGHGTRVDLVDLFSGSPPNRQPCGSRRPPWFGDASDARDSTQTRSCVPGDRLHFFHFTVGFSSKSSSGSKCQGPFRNRLFDGHFFKFPYS